MVAIRGRTFKKPWQRSCLSSKLKSSSAPIGREDSWCFHAVGSSNAPLLGSTAAEGLPRIGRTSIATHWRSCGLPQSASCSENFVIPPDVFGQTLSDWRALVSHLAHVLFPTPRPRGAPRKWTDERLCRLLADVAVLKRKHPKAPDTAICKWLEKKWPNDKPVRLRRVLQVARNPKHNTELARVVSILERRLGPDLLALDRTVEEGEVGTQAYDEDVRAKTVSWVIARADELWAR